MRGRFGVSLRRLLVAFSDVLPTPVEPPAEEGWRDAGCSRMCRDGHTYRWGSCAYGQEPPERLFRFRTGTASDGCVSGWHEALDADQVAVWLRERGYKVTPPRRDS